MQALAHGPPDADTLSKLLQAMQQALAQHLAAIRPAPSDQKAANFDTSALSKLAAQIAADEQAGRTAQAQAGLRQLAQALQALENAKPMTAAQAAQAQAASQAAQGLSQMIRNQAGLLNQTELGNATAGQQGALQAELNGLRQSLAKAGIPSLPGLAPAGQAMKNARDALAAQNTGPAESAENAAIQGLQKAAAALQRATQQELSIDASGSAPGELPIGNGANGVSEDYSPHSLTLPGNSPANAIEQEIIRLDANPNLPPATHDYLQRLLTPAP
jgi:hypothetical protein